MARLNEATGPAESIDALKRRFVRQNREIARVNSLQSLRIRGLESEVSRLLAENVSLREQVISLSQEVERLEATRMLHEGIYNIKARLDAKLAEMNNLVLDLGMLPRKFSTQCESRADSGNTEELKPSILNSRQKATVSEYSPILEDGRLPVILEDKYYPRKTLESCELHELQDLMNSDPDVPESSNPEQSSSGQPDHALGDSNIELAASVVRDHRIDTEMDGHEDVFLPTTLETRKKNKSNVRADVELNATQQPHSPLPQLSPTYTPKLGSKRKFDSKDGDEKYIPLSSEDDGDFKFSRPARTAQKLVTQISPIDEAGSSRERPKTNKSSGYSGTSKRKVLEPKSTNTNLTSPSKSRTSTLSDRKVQLGKDIHDEEWLSNPPRRRKTKTLECRTSDKRSSSQGLNQLEQEDDSPANSVEQGTSTLEEFTQSLPDQTTTRQEEDEPKSDMPSAPSRPTRRQRAVVSYAEPNLRDKMRRPTKELVDAVGGGHSRRVSSSQAVQTNDNDECKSEKTNLKSAVAGSETMFVLDTEDNEYGPLPKESLDISEQNLSMVSQRKRRTISANHDELRRSPDIAGPTFDPELVASVQPRAFTDSDNALDRQDTRSSMNLGKQRTREGSVAHLAAKTDTILASNSPNMAKAVTTTRRHSRRHSSNPRSLRQNASDLGNVDPSSETQQTFTADNSVELGNSTISAKQTKHPKTERLHLEGEDSSDMHLETLGSSTLSETSLAIDTRQMRRGDRAGARRRSMML